MSTRRIIVQPPIDPPVAPARAEEARDGWVKPGVLWVHVREHATVPVATLELRVSGHTPTRRTRPRRGRRPSR